MENSKLVGRITGFLYLVVIFCAGFSQGAVREVMYVAGEAATTAENILGNTSLFRWGLITDLIAFSTDIAISILLYFLLKGVSKPLAVIMASFRLIAHPAIGSLNLINHFAALKVLESEGLAAQFTSAQLVEMSQFFMEAHHYGYLIAGVLFGIHCGLLGYMMFKSASFPKFLGVLLVIAAFGYLIESFGFTLYPEHKVIFGWIVGLSAAVGEVTLCFWLMIKGTNNEVSLKAA
jgi:hypothetical protein